MLSNVFKKTLYEKRWSTLIWVLAIVGFALLVVLLFPTFRESFGKALTDVPDSLKSTLGEAADYQNINGYVDIQIVNQMVFLTLIMGIILGTSLIGGEESDGRLQTLLAQPISRTKVYWHKFAAMSLMVFIVCSGVFVGTLIGSVIIGEADGLNLSRLALAALMTWLVTMVFSGLSLVIGAASGKKGMAGVVSGFLAFTTFMITTLAGTATVLKSINHLSPFKYFNTPSVMKTGLDSSNLLVLCSIVIFLAIIGWLWFVRRDVYQK